MILPSESFARRSPSYRSKAPSERTRLTKLLSKLAKSRKYFLFSRNSFLNSSRASPAQGIIADRHEDAGRLSTISSRAARDTAACLEARPFSAQYDENVHVLRLLSTDLEHSRAWRAHRRISRRSESCTFGLGRAVVRIGKIFIRVRPAFTRPEMHSPDAKLNLGRMENLCLSSPPTLKERRSVPSEQSRTLPFTFPFTTTPPR